MRIVSVYIVGFGKFVQRRMDVSQNIVQLKQDNGWGKTTFVDFLECMFYGMDDGRKKSVAENFRVKYRPWQGEGFGGTLVFIAGGATYRVERTFGKTPSYDQTRIYDEKNNPVYAFGDKGEKLGETLFGVDRESYRRTVYLPQGEIRMQGFPQDVQGKLSALLTATDEKSGKKDAVTLLDEAERALRSKRAPKTGRLDVLEERLITLEGRRKELLSSVAAAKELREKAEAEGRALLAAEAKWRETDEKLAAYTRRKEYAANETLRRELQNNERETQRALGALAAFFGDTNPETVNVGGLRAALDEYYAVREQAERAKERTLEAERAAVEVERARMEWTAAEKSAETYRSLLNEEKKERKDTAREEKKARKRAGKRGGYALVGVCLFLAALLLGLTQVSANAVFGYVLTGVGAVGTLLCLRSFWKNTLAFSAKNSANKRLNEEYKAAALASARAKEAYEKLCEGAQRADAARAENETLTARLLSLDTAVQNFLSHFAVDRGYDYRAAADLIERNAAEYARQREQLLALQEKLAALPTPTGADGGYDEGEYTRLQALRVRLDEERAARQKTGATYRAQAEACAAEGAKLAECEETIATLQSERARLENRLYAVKTAKELILRARENLAAQYLVPVENACKRYAKGLGIPDGEKWRFSSSAQPLAEENGALRDSEYFSAGMRGVWDLCIRLALVEALFQKELPVLCFDDVLRDFDDRRTETGKQLLRGLSKRYQIVYCTCKEERAL